MPGRVTLTVTEGPRKDNRFSFDEHDVLLVGRAKECHLRLPGDDRTMSRRHCIIEINPPEARALDLGSFNGTIVNNVRHGGRPDAKLPADVMLSPQISADLRDGDIVRAGGTAVHVAIEPPGGRPKVPARTARPVRCMRCRTKLMEDAPPGHPLEALCDPCRRGELADPLKILREALPGGPPGLDVVRQIGRGGLGAVYLARRELDVEPVVLKIMLSRHVVPDAARAHFGERVQKAVDLRHGNFARVFQQGSSGRVFHATIEYCPGGSLRDLMNQHAGPVPLPVAAPLMLQALEGLAFLHGRGLVHRDVKPSNVLLAESPGGPARISDLGFAAWADEAGLLGMTITGEPGPSHPFMPRDLITAFRKPLPAADVWSAAATFYAMLTGEPPRAFPAGRIPVDVMMQDAIVPIRRRKPDIPESVAEVLQHALADEPEKRYPSAAEFRDDLAAALR